jgi:hypothetical protein
MHVEKACKELRKENAMDLEQHFKVSNSIVSFDIGLCIFSFYLYDAAMLVMVDYCSKCVIATYILCIVQKKLYILPNYAYCGQWIFVISNQTLYSPYILSRQQLIFLKIDGEKKRTN